MRPPRVGVIGSGTASGPLTALAREAGRVLAERGAVLVCGGLGGVMAAAAEGARSAGGHVLGFLPGPDPEAAAGAVTLPVATGLGEARNVLVVRASEAVIAVGGGWGTLSEAAFCMKLRVPLVGLEARLPADPGWFDIPRFHEPSAAAARALELARERRGRKG